MLGCLCVSVWVYLAVIYSCYSRPKFGSKKKKKLLKKRFAFLMISQTLERNIFFKYEAKDVYSLFNSIVIVIVKI